jgi:hypothetical protein
MAVNDSVIATRYIKTGRIADLPAMGAGATNGRGYPSGHVFINRVGGKEYNNLGMEQSTLHVSQWANYQFYDEAFLQLPVLNASNAFGKNPNFELIGVNGANADVTQSTSGGIAVATHGANADSTIIQPQQTAGQSAFKSLQFNTGKAIRFETSIKTGANITAANIYFGFKLTNVGVSATDADQTFIRYQDTINSGKWQTVDSNTGTLNATDTGITVAVSTRYHCVIQVDINRLPRYFINGVQVGTGAVLKANTNLIPFFGILAGAAAVKTFDITGLRCGLLLS